MKCHWLVLCERSDYFRTMFEGDFKETQDGGTIRIAFDMNEELLRSVIGFLYGMDIEFNNDNFFIILQMSHMYGITHLHEAASDFFVNSLDQVDHPLDVLDKLELFLSEEKRIEAEKKLVDQLMKMNCEMWMKSVQFLALSAQGITSLLKRPDIHCHSETDLLEALVHWWEHQPNEREACLGKVIKEALNWFELNVDQVRAVLAPLNLDTAHPFSELASALPIGRITSPYPARTNTDRVTCFVLHILWYFRSKFAVYKILFDVRGGEINRFRGEGRQENANDLIEVAGISFVQESSTFEFFEMGKPDAQRLTGDFLFDLNKTVYRPAAWKQFLLIKINRKHAERELVLTVYETRASLHNPVRDGKVTVPFGQLEEDEHILHVYKEYLFVFHCAKQSVLVFELSEMKVKAKVSIKTNELFFQTAAQHHNILVFVGLCENYVFDFEDIILAASSDDTTHSTTSLSPLATFLQAETLDKKDKFSAEILGNRFFVLIMRRNGNHLVSYSCDLSMIMQRGPCNYKDEKNRVKWMNESMIMPYDMMDFQVQWIDLQRRSIARDDLPKDEFFFVRNASF